MHIRTTVFVYVGFGTYLSTIVAIFRLKTNERCTFCKHLIESVPRNIWILFDWVKV